MKNRSSIVVLIIFFTIGFIYPVFISGAGTKHALIIAISRYKGRPDWARLSSDNDADLLNQTLEKIGFKGHITTKKNEACTKDGIMKAIGKLIHDVQPGDIALLHYSGHGAQIEDLTGKQGDNLDECWVPVDASIPETPQEFTAKQDKYLRGKDIKFLLDSLRHKLGKDGDLLVMVDACCSSGSTRGRGMGGVNRGLDRPILYDPSKFTQIKSTDKLFKEWGATAKSVEMSDYVVIAAARGQEEDQEIDIGAKGFGPLSYAFCTSVLDLYKQKSTVTYTALFESIKLVMNQYIHDQMPEIDGTGKNKGIFGGGKFGLPVYFHVTSWVEGNKHLLLDAGTVQGVTKGSKIGIFRTADISTHDAKNQIVQCTVDSAAFFYSYISLDSMVDPQPQVLGIVTSYNTSNIPKVMLGVKGNDKNILASLRKHFERDSFDLVTLTTDKPELLLEPTAASKRFCIRINGEIYRDDISIDDDAAMWSLDTAIQNYAQYRYLKKLQLTNNNIHVSVQILSSKNGQLDSSLYSKANQEGTLSFDTGTYIAFHVKNDGAVNAYVNIVDMSPDGSVRTYLPNTDTRFPQYYPVAKCFLKAGEDYYYYDVPALTLGPPFGNEILKVFVTKDELNLEDIVNTRGADSRGGGVNTTLSQLFKKSFNIGSRGIKPPNASLDEGTVYSITFEITDPTKRVATSNK